MSFTPAQAMALASMTVPPAVVQAVADARAALARASLTLPANAADLQAKADALAKAEQALAVARANELARVGGASLNLTPDQLAAVIANNGLPRGGNTSPGGTFAYGDYTGFTKIWDGQTLTAGTARPTPGRSSTTPSRWTRRRKPGQHHIHFTGLPGSARS